jgi:sugar phosphate isomerase/epimerase
MSAASQESRHISRRSFLRTAGGALAAAGGLESLAGCAAAGARAAAAAERVRVPAHLWVYASTQPGYDPTPVLDTVFADMKYAGMEGVEVMHNVLLHEDAVARVGALSRKHDLPVTGSSFGAPMWDRAQHGAILADAERVVTRLGQLGGGTLGVTANRAPAIKTADQLDAQAAVIRRMMEMCEANGIVLNLHNHTWEVENDLYELRGMLERIPEVKLGPDLNWLVRGGVDPVAFIDRYGDRIVYLHLRDQYAGGRWSEAVGEGAMDFVVVGEALRRNRFSGHAAIELAFERDFAPTRPLRESLRMSREFVRRTLGY